jgi:hypothetical protein
MGTTTGNPAGVAEAQKDREATAPKYRAVLPPELEGLPDEPSMPLDLDAFEHWAKTGEGDPWSPGA